MKDTPPKEKLIHIAVNLPQELLDAVKERAKAQGIPYTRYVRMLMERDVAAK